MDVIELHNVSKTFQIPHEKINSLREGIIGALSRKKILMESLKVIDDISLKIKKGEIVGIIGKNGAGKSTLLRIMAKLLLPDKGKVIVKEKIAPLLSLGLGFQIDFTAKENVYLSCAILGIERKETSKIFDKIIRFAELENFVDTKIKNFSSGMTTRLAFATTIQAQAPVLLIDEALAVGDLKFRNKCLEVFAKFKEEKKTIVLVSHDLGVVQGLCDRVILMDNGRIISDGPPTEIINDYLSRVNPITEQQNNKKEDQEANDEIDKKIKKSNEKIIELEETKRIEHIKKILYMINHDPRNPDRMKSFHEISEDILIDNPFISFVKKPLFSIKKFNTIIGTKKTNRYSNGSKIKFVFEIDSSINKKNIHLGLQLRTETGIKILGVANSHLNKELDICKGRQQLILSFNNLNLLKGKYMITYALYKHTAKGINMYHLSINKYFILVDSNCPYEGIIDPDFKYIYKKIGESGIGTSK